jgi:hypothetical protein
VVHCAKAVARVRAAEILLCDRSAHVQKGQAMWEIVGVGSSKGDGFAHFFLPQSTFIFQ